MDKQCTKQIMEFLPGVVCHFKQNYCSTGIDGLTMQQHRLLSCLADKQKSVSELAEKLEVSMPAISRMILGLIKEKLITKETNIKDKRQVYLSLSKEGKLALSLSRKQSFDKLFPKIKKLSANEKKILLQSFSILQKLTDKEGNL